MPAGEAQDDQRRGYPVGNAVAWIRELCRGTQDLPVEIQRGKYHKCDKERQSVLLGFHWTITEPRLPGFFLFLFAPNKTKKNNEQ